MATLELCGLIVAQIPLWFSEEPSDEQAFNRMAYLKKLFFDIFANHAADPPELDYVDMVQVWEILFF